MARKKASWIDTCERFVAFLDIMGFKDRVLTESSEDIKNMFDSLCAATDIINILAQIDLGMIQPPKGVRASSPHNAIISISFSDSIILISGDGSQESGIKMLLCIEKILKQAMLSKIPIKGSITYGEMTAYLRKSVYFGKPLIDAYELQKELLLYGVVLHHTSEKRIKLLHVRRLFERYLIFQSDIPMKSGKINHCIIEWTPAPGKEKELIDSLKELYNSVSGKPRIYIDNTLECISKIIEQKTELEQKKMKDKSV